MTLFDHYVRAICRGMTLEGKHQEMRHLNTLVLASPPVEFHLIVDRTDVTTLHRIDEDGSLHAYARRFIFDTKWLGEQETHYPQGMLMARRRLAALDDWEEWRTLHGYLSHQDMVPFVMFHNEPVRIDGTDYYAGDIRLWVAKGYVLP